MDVILVINAGSSSIKFSIFNTEPSLNLIYHGILDITRINSRLIISDSRHIQVINEEILSTEYTILFRCIFDWFYKLPENYTLVAVGHRVVHGGSYFSQPTIISPEVMNQISQLIPLAPLHQGHNLDAIRIINDLYPKLKQVACFDTTFHNTQHHLAKLFALPRHLTTDGIIRYGFHGISYEYIASVITQHIGETGNKRVIVAHLGNGASMCAMYQRKSVATSMGFTALDGLMMGSRCGRIDVGVILYLMQEKHYSVDQILQLLYRESGLLGVSGISSDMRDLLSSGSPYALEAIELFCYYAALEIGSLCVALGGCDALIFTAGIGEHTPQIRQKICNYLHWLGVKLDDQTNSNNATIISSKDSQIIVGVIPTNEEYMIAQHTRLLN